MLLVPPIETSMTKLDIFLLVIVIAFSAYLIFERFRLKDYNVPSGDLPDGVLLRTYCRKTTHVQVVSDGEGYSRPIETKNAPQCGYSKSI